mmetsp:Transcript_91235/g.260598  ORF Transcript_91235/g.260598 Transcript_91235/m.260598 type:complete len:210 (+) Transcript_91235:72-701(+)
MAQVALPPSSTWRVTLFRGVRDGDLDVVKRVSEQHPHSIHEKFTEAMHDWELEWDSVRWFEYREATCLFLACAHTHPHIVEWLIENGVDTDTECGHHQKAIDVIGLSNDNPAKNKSIKELLKQPKKGVTPCLINKFRRNIHRDALSLFRALRRRVHAQCRSRHRSRHAGRRLVSKRWSKSYMLTCHIRTRTGRLYPRRSVWPRLLHIVR